VVEAMELSMSTMLILGGVRSGKSTHAEMCCKQKLADERQKNSECKLHYIATATPFDEEMKQRIAHHQQRRDDEWIEHEVPLHLAQIIDTLTVNDIVLVDCLTVWLNNIIYNDGQPLSSSQIKSAVSSLVASLNASDATIYVVSNEVGFGVVPLGQVSRLFVDHAGWMNQAIAGISEQVILVVAGLPLMLKPA
jgi:adenosylcobinamide kinase / adenosylcobinamide-phosphate guanylyltransferase